MSRKRQIEAAFWTDFARGMVRLCKDWKANQPPPLHWAETGRALTGIARLPQIDYALESGYMIRDGMVTFVVPSAALADDVHPDTEVFVAGAFNGWVDACNERTWRLEPTTIDGRECRALTVQREAVGGTRHEPGAFKFLTGSGTWLPVPGSAPNAVHDKEGNRNHALHFGQGGMHQFSFTTPRSLSDDGQASILWRGSDGEEEALLIPGDFLLELESGLPLGASIEDGSTVFRLFAPRASGVQAVFFQELASEVRETCRLERVDSCVWEGRVERDLTGWFYHYSVAGKSTDPHSQFDAEQPVLDPYARLVAGPGGPGIITDSDRLPLPSARFQPPAWQDLVIAEAHVRDLTARAPIEMDEEERLGFRGLARWVRDEHFHLKQLGINAVELQPVQQFDAHSREEYHWGYMPTNWFAPCCWYASRRDTNAAYHEFQDLVAAFHEREMAVLLDVVYNHVGEPNHLMFIDKHYYFEIEQSGEPVNWSGCGNTVRCNTPMTERLIIESLCWFVERFDVDGFRFDLAELIGITVLRRIERALKAIKPGIILIAEPWSFRRHFAHALRETGFAYWNDGFREFLPEYVRGHGDPDGLRYFLSGSLGGYAAWPAQSVNYTESHDDHAWIDRITENREHDGSEPTPRDRRRTHLMASVLFCSLGIPMISSGQDMLRSKQGVANTYQDEELNALHYDRAIAFSATHEYFRRWIRFRLSSAGRHLRLYTPPSGDFLSFYGRDEDAALAALFNADHRNGDGRLLFAVNPHLHRVSIDLPDLPVAGFTQVADAERFVERGLRSALFSWCNGSLTLPPMQCGLWVES